MATDPTGTTRPLVERVKRIIASPKTEWPVIAAEPATIGGIYRNYVAILAAIPAVAMALGLLIFGLSLIVVTVRPSVGYVISNAIVSYVLSLIGVYVLALIIETLAPSFGGEKNRLQAFKLAAYSYTPAWVAGILYLLPSLAMLVLIASIYSIYLLYLGLPILMRSAPEKTAVYLLAIVVAGIVLAVVVTAVTGAITSSFAPIAATPGYPIPT